MQKEDGLAPVEKEVTEDGEVDWTQATKDKYEA
jgi:hypothetical protein